ncbi:MAG: carbohydrate ABC transporter permease [Lachnospiraceae bacterium]|nr:carbohydrate ABC transporter permease [Lachnospiraceae bacterium]MDY3221798.1 carbohydrate ABC transporter permease [Lachnospiraceae bacterium]
MNKRTLIVNRIMELILWLFSIVTIYPILMVVLTSFKSKGEAAYLNISLPQKWLFENYITVMEKDFIRSLKNSIFITLLSIVLITGLAAFISFIIARRDTKGCRIVYKIITLGIIAPFTALPTIQLLQKLGLYGTRTGLCFIYAALYMPFTTMILSGFIKGIPRELDEAAVMDGAIGGRLFLKVILPLLKPALATTGILNFMWVWNELQIPMYLLNSSAKWTLPLSVYNFYGQYSRSWNLVCADVVLVSLPVVIVYIFAQKWIISGMTAGAVKG